MLLHVFSLNIKLRQVKKGVKIIQIRKEREEPSELKYFRLLEPRKTFTAEEKRKYLKVKKGFEGEKQFDRRLRKDLKADCLVINGLLLEHNETAFQIDSLLLFQNVNYVIEVKNFEGDFYTIEDRWHGISGNEIKDPLQQINRSESSFRQLLQFHRLQSPLNVNARLVFINLEFYLYNASMSLPVIFSNQLNRFIKKLNESPAKINQKQEQLATHLISRHQDDLRFTRVPNYSYHQLKKGIVCSVCPSFLDFKESKWVCNECGHIEKFEEAVLRAVDEFKFLFPENKLTTKAICDWCSIQNGRKNIRRILNKHFKRIGTTKNAYYV
ncbi:nuclease-related domain-containing protein [Natribacillus halophilus]|uniref:Nuclease-related domain-containing protein n=1 Tax=Natribacillus halophilus TaxID=549003 RepID=A0A1G8LIR9_9BACI|nr:nuclease-related domain-containing protein [Natribacillus halophilus]SDI55574.1 Nuclease-related domain-containing protein [Natribacillus halophilus]